MTNIEVGKTALVTVDSWFYAPDGKQYRAVFGKIKSVKTAEESLGVRPNGKSTNWYLEIGNMIIAGCQIHYMIQTNDCNPGNASDYTVTNEGTLSVYERPCAIYFSKD